MKNYPLLRKTMETIDADPESHDQGSWGTQKGCGTTMCFAGHAAFLSGAVLIWEKSDTEIMYADECMTPEGGRQEIEIYAARQLGLDSREVADLFYDAETIEDLHAVMELILAQEAQEA